MSLNGKSTFSAGQTRTEIRATPMGIRQALADTRRSWKSSGAIKEICETGEQVLAEILNNVVEHALAGQPDGNITVESTATMRELVCIVRDDGAPMPNDLLPTGRCERYVNRDSCLA